MRPKPAIPPARDKIAASLDWEAAPLGDLLDLSASVGVEAGDLYRAVNHLARVHAERVRDVRED